MRLGRYAKLWSALRSADFRRFVDMHNRLYDEAEATGDYGRVTAAYYEVMAGVIGQGYGANWHFFPPQHAGQRLGDAIRAGHECLAQRLPLGPEQRALDIGSGIGGWMRFAARRTGASFVGISIGAEEVATANALHRKGTLGGRCQTLLADARDMPFDANAFDAATAIYTLKYFSRTEPVFREIARVLRPGGVLLTYNIVRSTPSSPARDQSEDVVRRVEYSTGMPPLRSAAGLIEGASACGLSCVEHSDLVGEGPWYHYLQSSWLTSSVLPSRASIAILGLLESMHLAPKGVARFHETFIAGTVSALREAGQRDELNGASVLVFRKD